MPIDLSSKITEWNRRYNYWRNGTDYNPKGIDIFTEDWDNLIILDACRYDIFKNHHPFEGTLKSRISRGSTTKEFIRANFRNKHHLNTAYLSDNGWYGRLYEEIDSQIYDFYQCERDAFDGAVSDPETVTEVAIDYAETHADKRLIVHYLQPHDPYFDQRGNERFALESHSPRKLKKIGRTREEIQDAYVENFNYVVSSVSRLLPVLEGKTVITADHGELLGEWTAPIPGRVYEHPEGNYVSELVKVPWLVIDGESRRQITSAESPTSWADDNGNVAQIEDQLKKLGYL